MTNNNFPDWIKEIFDLMETETDPTPVMSAKELSKLNAKEVKPEKIPAGCVFIGSTFEAYGDRRYYKTPNNEYIYTYYSIGD